ncbi:hypothetical protein [Streptomyces sp. NPDC007205]
MSADNRTVIATAALGATSAGIVAVEHPVLVPALTFALAVWVALCAFLKG